MAVSDITLESLDARIEALAVKTEAGFAKDFEQTQGGFEEFGRFAMFLDQRLREDMKARFEQVDKRFNQIDRRFDSMDERFDRLEKLIKGRPVAPGQRPRARR